MPITVFSDVILSNAVLSAGVRGKNIRLNSRVPVDNGYESINVIWSHTLRQYELGTVPMLPAQWREIVALHEITEGGAYGFLMEDPNDSLTPSGVVTAISSTVFQMHNRYTNTVSARYKDRIITRPRLTDLVVEISGTPTTSYTLDVTTGRLTIAAAPSAATVTWTGKFYVPVHFMEDSIDWDLLAGGVSEQRLLAGPSVVLMEVRE